MSLPMIAISAINQRQYESGLENCSLQWVARSLFVTIASFAANI